MFPVSFIEQVKFPSNQPLATLHNLKYTAALTRPLQVLPSASYSPPLIVGFEQTYMYVGGVNMPKRLLVKTSDGQQHYELLKGRDDIRQDAVMEQVSYLVSSLRYN